MNTIRIEIEYPKCKEYNTIRIRIPIGIEYLECKDKDIMNVKYRISKREGYLYHKVFYRIGMSIPIEYHKDRSIKILRYRISIHSFRNVRIEYQYGISYM